MSKEKMEVVMTLWKVVEIDEDNDKANEQWDALHSQMLEVVRNCPELSDWDWDMQWDVARNEGGEFLIGKATGYIEEEKIYEIYEEGIRKGVEELRELFDKDKVDALSTKEV